MRFSSIVLLAFAGFAAAQTPIPPSVTAPTGSVTVTSTASTSRTRSFSGTRSGTSSLSGTLTASVNSTSTLTTSSATPTTTTFPTLGNATPCVANCLQVSIAQSNCSAITQVDCYCTSERFRSSLVQCVAAGCPTDLSSAEQLGQQFCNIVSVSLTYPPAPTSTAPVSTSSTGTSSPTSSANGASRREHGLWTLVALALGVVAF